jgi:predicted Fe-S protein YdhL (DUF1289 family)
MRTRARARVFLPLSLHQLVLARVFSWVLQGSEEQARVLRAVPVLEQATFFGATLQGEAQGNAQPGVVHGSRQDGHGMKVCGHECRGSCFDHRFLPLSLHQLVLARVFSWVLQGSEEQARVLRAVPVLRTAAFVPANLHLLVRVLDVTKRCAALLESLAV